MPLERDEGEYAYSGQLMLHGIPPYKLAYTMKLPGTQTAYAAIMAIFGQTPAGIHLGLILVNAATILLVYLLAARLSGRLGGLVAAASYAALSASFTVMGMAAHATHFVALFAMAGILVLLQALDTGQLWRFFAGGLLLGLAFLMKQPGIAFAVFGGLYLLKSEWRQPVEWKSLLSKTGGYGAGVALPFALTCLVVLASGSFRDFWFWVFTYARQYTSENGLAFGVQVFMHNFPRIVGSYMGLWVFAAVGLTAFLWHQESRRHAALIGGLLFFSFLAVCPGLFFRQHYFILMLPVVAILVGVAVHATMQILASKGGVALSAIALMLFLGVFGYSLTQQSGVWGLDPLAACRKLYGDNLFPEAVVIAQFLEEQTSATDRIAVLGSEPEIYFYAKRHSATGFIYMYGLMEQQKYALEMQKKMIGEIEAAHPQFVVSVRSRFSWLANPESDEARALSGWASKYIEVGYELVGVAERVGNHSEYHWGENAKAYQPRSANTVVIFKRKD